MKASLLNTTGAAILFAACAMMIFHHRQSEETSISAAPSSAENRKREKAPSGGTGTSTTGPFSTRSLRPRSPLGTATRAKTLEDTATAPVSGNSESTNAQAIRLADNFRLPAVLMPSRDEQDQPADLPEPVAVAARGISDRFYQDVAMHAASRAQNTPTTTNPAADPRPSRHPTSSGSGDGTSAPMPGDLPDRAAAGRPLSDTPGIPSDGSSGLPSENPEEPPVGNPAPSTDPDGTLVIKPGDVPDDITDRADEQFRSLFGNDAFNRRSMEAAVEVSLPAASADGN